MCSGMIDPEIVVHALSKGADGVLGVGCHLGECHYLEGNEKATRVLEKTRKLMKLLGIEDGRLRKEWVSASEGSRFASLIEKVVSDVEKLKTKNKLVKTI